MAAIAAHVTTKVLPDVPVRQWVLTVPWELRRLLDADDRTQVSGAQEEDAGFDHRKRSPWAAEIDGFSVHAGVHIRLGDAKGREILLRYCARPALSLERLSVQSDGRIAYRTKYPGRGGKTHRLMTPHGVLGADFGLDPGPAPPRVSVHGRLRAGLGMEEARRSGCKHPAADGAAESMSRARKRRTPRADSPRKSNGVSHSAPETKSTPAARAASKKHKDSLRADDSAHDAHIGRRSTSYIDWPSLILRSYDIDVLSARGAKVA
jgi:hypothetical protein